MKENFQWSSEVEEEVNRLSMEMHNDMSMHFTEANSERDIGLDP